MTLTAWEQAYVRFETPEQEVRKFVRRLVALGARTWPRDSRIVELFCGRGNGLAALKRLGFENIMGVDASRALASTYRGPGVVLVGDCRALPLRTASRDVMIVQGGLHHLPRLPEDLDRTLDECARVLNRSGRLVIVEPWLTPFLSVAHAISRVSVARRLSPKVDAFATMIEHERPTYEAWLAAPDLIRTAVRSRFVVEFERTTWGKLLLLARPR